LKEVSKNENLGEDHEFEFDIEHFEEKRINPNELKTDYVYRKQNTSE
jgi:hypothetical protein